MKHNFSNHIISTLKNACVNFAQENPTLVSSFIYGSNVKSLQNNSGVISNEIDLLLITTCHLQSGETPFPEKSLARYFDGLPLEEYRFKQIRNGIPPTTVSSDVVLLDIIGDGLPNIKAHEPSSIITALKPRILLTGINVYKTLEYEHITPHIRKTIFDTLIIYLRREFYHRTDNLAKSAIAKNAIFICSLLNDDAVRQNDKSTIVAMLTVQYPDLAEYFSWFLNAYQHPEVLQSDAVRAMFDNFADYFQKEYVVS